MSREFSFIKPFRAIAAFWVVTGHSLQWWGIYVPTYFVAPKMAVDLFMMISGYLMAANAFARHSREPLSEVKNWLRFWARRYFRVAPAYYLSLIVVVLFSGPFLDGYQQLIHLAYGNALEGSDYDPATIHYSAFNILMHLSFLFGLSPAYAASTYLPDWSLSLEMQFYFVFPALFLMLCRFGFAVSAFVTGCAAFVLGLLLSRHVHFPEPSLLVFKLNYFLAGMVLYRFLAGGLGRRQSIIMGSMAIALVSIDYHYRLLLLLLTGLMGLMLLLGRLELEGKTPAWVSRLIESRVVQVASDTSYSVYLFHGFFIAAAGLFVESHRSWIAEYPRVFNWTMYGFVVICSYALASVVYRLVELPGIRLGKRVIDRWLPRSLETPARPGQQQALPPSPLPGH